MLAVVVVMKEVAVAVAMAIAAVVGHLISSRSRNFKHQDEGDINKDYGNHKNSNAERSHHCGGSRVSYNGN